MARILAPAGSLEGCAAALEAGAHGVYLGAKTWSRGPAAHALTNREIAGCVNLARARDRVVHVAVNTIPACQDADLLIDNCLDYISLGAGGLILNDFGLMSKLLSVDPAAPVYASVGCAISNIADVEFYQNLGVAGVVLPPRVLPGEIKEIKEKCAVKVEIFCEVLLEPFLFGKCWLGGYCSLRRKTAGGKECFHGSAKRGGCSKGCKTSWDVFRESELLAGGLTLPFEPFSLMGSLKAYVEAGVDFLKIQGRSLAPEVVAGIVKKYQEVLDDGCREG